MIKFIYLEQVKTKSWFGSVEVMDYLCDNWTLLGTVLDHALQKLGDAACARQRIGSCLCLVQGIA